MTQAGNKNCHPLWLFKTFTGATKKTPLTAIELFWLSQEKLPKKSQLSLRFMLHAKEFSVFISGSVRCLSIRMEQRASQKLSHISQGFCMCHIQPSLIDPFLTQFNSRRPRKILWCINLERKLA